MDPVYVGALNSETLNRILRTYEFLKLNMGCEVGVREGLCSEYLLKQNPNLHMVCVDPYLPYQDVDQFYTEEMQSEIRLEAAHRLSVFGDRASLVYKLSVPAAKTFDDGFFDFVFLDADHSYENAVADVGAWITKVRSGGIMSGHDYSMGGVNRAVNEVAAAYGKVIRTSPPSEGDVWWFAI